MTAPPVTDGQAPGVYLRDVFPPPAPTLLTGVPAFLGYASQGPVDDPQPLTLWPQFQAHGSVLRGRARLPGLRRARLLRERRAALLRGPSRRRRRPPLAGLRAGLGALRPIDAVDLVCAPDIMISASPTGAPDVGRRDRPAGRGPRRLPAHRRPVRDPGRRADQRHGHRRAAAGRAVQRRTVRSTTRGCGPLGKTGHRCTCRLAGMWRASTLAATSRSGVHKAPANEIRSRGYSTCGST